MKWWGLALLLLWGAGTQTQAALPPLRARDVQGKVRTLEDFRGRPVALYFFCGCAWCRECGPLLAGRQRQPPAPGKPAPATVIAYAGDAAQTRAFARAHRLAKSTVLIPDPKFQLAQAFGAIPCPRAFVLDRRGQLLYTNTRPDDAAQKGKPQVLMTRAWTSAATGRPFTLPSAPAAAATPTGRLTVLPAPGIERAGPTTARAAFPTVEELDAQPVTYTFPLRNEGNGVLQIGKIEAACGCSRVRVQLEGEEEVDAAATPLSLPPGHWMEVRFTVDLAEVGSGAINKAVWIYPAGSSKAAATLEIHGRIHPAVEFSPEFLEFGDLPAGKPRTVTVTARLNPRLAGPQTAPRLVSPVPYLRASAPSALPGNRFRYTVTLAADAPLGVLPDALHLQPAPGAPLEGRPRKVLAETALSILGKVVGEIRAEPELVILGEAPAAGSVQKVTLTAPAPLWAGAAASCPNPWVRVRLTTAPGRKPPPTLRVLEISLKPETPPGRLNTTVEVRLRTGRRLVIPFEVDITPRQGS